MELPQAYRYCEWITTGHYENFPVASWLLPRAVRPHIAAIYAFARSADDFADELKYRGRSLELLQGWRAALRLMGTDCFSKPGFTNGEKQPVPFSHPIFLALADTVRRRDLPVQLLDDLLTAFTMDVTKKRYADWEELLTYCRYSANPVGRLVLLVFGIREPRLHDYSDRICTALQLTNHWQDLRIDWAKGMLYVPQSLLREHGMEEADLQRTESVASSQKFRALMADLVARARRLFDEGAPLIREVSGPLRLELKLTLLGGRAILDRMEGVGHDVFARRPVLSKFSKIGLLARAVFS